MLPSRGLLSVSLRYFPRRVRFPSSERLGYAIYHCRCRRPRGPPSSMAHGSELGLHIPGLRYTYAYTSHITAATTMHASGQAAHAAARGRVLCWLRGIMIKRTSSALHPIHRLSPSALLLVMCQPYFTFSRRKRRWMSPWVDSSFAPTNRKRSCSPPPGFVHRGSPR